MTLIKFILVGSLNTFFYYLVYALLIYIQLNYPLAVFIATLITMFVSFKSFSQLVFHNKNNKLIYKFIVVTIFNFVLNTSAIYIFKDFGYNSYIAGLFAAFVVVVNSFFLNKFFVFKQ